MKTGIVVSLAITLTNKVDQKDGVPFGLFS
jgi:hypothetical protein